MYIMTNGQFVKGQWIEITYEPPLSQIDRLQVEFIQFVNYVNDLVTSHNELVELVKIMNVSLDELSDAIDVLNGKTIGKVSHEED